MSQDNAGESVNYYPEATIETYRQETDLVVKQTDYILTITKEQLDTEMMYLLLFKNIGSGNSHFIASRSTNLNGEIASFKIRSITSGLIRSQKLYGSNNVESESGALGLRPIVRLNRDVQISELGGTAAMPRTLSR